MVHFRLLGPVEMVTATHAVDIGPRKRQAVLTALLVDAGAPVPVETITDRVWGDAPPATARGAVHSYVTGCAGLWTRPTPSTGTNRP
jgi:DNA-binding SARP family transcriptional activator